MPPKKGHVARKRKGQSNNTMQHAAKASAAAAASTGLNPSPVGRPTTQEAAAALSPPTAPLQGSMMMMALLIHNCVLNYVLGPYAGSQ